ncbi:MAG: sigma 54-interacting transcriptional regulator [bacterium]
MNEASTLVVDELLGEGTWGKVYRVHNQRAESFALKWLKAEPPGGWADEGAILSRLSHPHLVHIEGFLPRVQEVKGLSESGPAFLMEYVSGPSLEEYLAKADADAVLDAFVQALRALAYLQARRILHGDLKPSNLRLDKKKRLKFLDFGFAAVHGENQTPGPIAGTWDFLAPEALAGQRGPASDLFALATVFYRLWGGAWPYPKRELAERFSEAPRPLLELRKDCPEFFSAILSRMLEADPSRRFSSAAAVLRALALHRPKVLAGEAAGELQHSPVVGRDALLSPWEEALRLWQAGEAKPPRWFLQGPAGAGRSRCVEELRWQAARRGLNLLAFWDSTSLAERLRGAEAVREPSLLALEDLHDWSEAELKDFENFCGSLEARAPQLGLVLEWDPSRAAAEQRRRCEALFAKFGMQGQAIAPLDRPASDALLQELLWERPLPEAFLTAACADSGGLPALLVEIARAARSSAKPGEGFSLAINWEGLALPERQREALARLWQNFTTGERAVLLAGALLPEGISRPWLEAALEKTEAELSRPLGALRQGGFLEEAAGRWRIHPPLYRRAWLDLAPREERRAAAGRLFELLRDSPEGEALTLARLAREAGRAEDFWRFGTRAAERLTSEGKTDEAAALYRELFETATGRAEQAFASAHLAACLSRLARFEEAAQAYDRWYRLTEDDGSGVQTLKYHYLLGLNFMNQGKPAQAGKELRRALEVGDPRRHEQHRPFYLQSLTLLGRLEEQQGRRAEARRHYEAGLEWAEGPAREKTQLLRQYGLFLLAEGREEAGQAKLEEALKMSLDLEYDEGVANTAAVLAERAQRAGDYDRALRIHEQVLRLAERHQDPLKQARTHSNMASVLIELADYAHAAEHVARAEPIFQVQGTDLDRLIHRFHEATLQVYLGHFQEAQDPGLEKLARHLGQKEVLAYLERLRGEAARLQRDFQEAIACHARARAAFLGCGRPEEADLSRLQEVFTECLAGDAEAALRRLRETKPAAPWAPLFQWFEAMLRAERPGVEAQLREGLGPLLKNNQQELVVLALFAASELWARRKAKEATEFFRHRAFEWLEALYRALPEELQLGFEQREDYRRLAEARLLRLKTSGLSRERFLSFARINKRLGEESEMRSIHEQVMDAAMALAGAERGFLLIREEPKAGQVLPGFRVEAARNMKKENLNQEEFKISLSVVEEALRRRVSLLTDDAQADPNFRHAESVHRYELKSILVLPLLGASGSLGALYLDHRFEVGAFSEEKLLFLKAFADQSVLALEKARTLGELAAAKRALEHRVELQAHELERLETELKEARKHLKFRYEEIIGQSPRMMKLLGLLDRVTDTRVPVWIHGESGTGKELIARALHFNSDRKARPFIAENCSAIPENLLESVLFGHVKGAFTHAERDRMGLFEAADGGTIFLDEIGDMPMPMQAKLLRVLQEGEVRRVGANRSVKVDVRVVSATNKNLPEMVKRGEFREDLFFRLNGLRIELPALRERKEDIPLLVQHFLKKIAAENGLEPCGISEQALVTLANYDWPGNIRELENTLRNAVLFAEGKTITSELLGFKPELWRPAPVLAATAAEPPPTAPAAGNAEREAILDAMVRAAFHKGRAAEELHITPRHLYNLLEKYELPKNKWALKKLVETERRR